MSRQNTSAASSAANNQQHRSAVTRDKILDATFQILRDLGHAGLRSANVSTESGVSRGGLLHHYPTKEDLVVGVYERIYDSAEEQSWQRINSVEDKELLSAIVDDARSRFFDDSYKVMLDIKIACSREKPFIQIHKALQQRHPRSAREGWAERLVNAGVEPDKAEQIAGYLWNMIRGIAVRNLVRQDEVLTEQIIALGLKLARRQCADYPHVN